MSITRRRGSGCRRGRNAPFRLFHSRLKLETTGRCLGRAGGGHGAGRMDRFDVS